MRSRAERSRALALLAAALLLGAGNAPATELYPDVGADRLTHAAADDGWLMYRRSYDSRGFAPFTEIGPANVAQLKVAFTYDTGFVQGHESPPIVNGRTLIVTTPLSNVVALDAVTGKVLWKYDHDMDTRALRTICCDVVNRGVALAGDSVYLGTVDDQLVALDGRTGAVRWHRAVETPGRGYAITAAPLVVDDLVITGIAGGEYGAPGFVAAFDARTGEPRWKTSTIPAPGAPGSETWPRAALAHGGGSTWLTGSYDPATRTLYWGVGNPGPWRADLRPGRNLDTDSVLALDVRTGKRKWGFQYTPNDSWDFDGVNESVLVPGAADRPLLVHADRNGHVVAIDARNGRFVWSTPFVKATAVRGYRPDGTPIVDPAAYPHVGHDAFVCPSSAGGKNWYPTAYDPHTHLLFVPTLHLCMNVSATELDPDDIAHGYFGERTTLVAEPGHPDLGELQAFDVRTGRRAWSFSSGADPWTGGVLATASGLVFSGAGRTFMAFDAASGRRLWSTELSSGIIGVPTTYRVDGKQYVAVYAGWGGGLALFGGPSAQRGNTYPRGGKLYVFTL